MKKEHLSPASLTGIGNVPVSRDSHGSDGMCSMDVRSHNAKSAVPFYLMTSQWKRNKHNRLYICIYIIYIYISILHVAMVQKEFSSETWMVTWMLR